MRARRKKNSTARSLISLFIFIAGIALACYIGLWLLFIKPIMGCCSAFDAGTLSALIVGTTVIKCLLASAIAGIIIYVSSFVAGIISM